MAHSLERELADQLVEARFGETLGALRCDLAETIAANENLAAQNRMLRDQRDRLQAILEGLRAAAEPTPLHAVPRTGLSVVPTGGISA
jgi:hypothetical protein